MIVLLCQVLQWDPTTPWSSLTRPTTESKYLTSLDKTGVWWRSIWLYLGNPWPAFDWEKCFWWYLSTIFDKYLTRFWLGGYGNGEGEFDCLAGVAVNRIGQFIIADRWPTQFSTSFGLWTNEVLSRYNHRIQIFDPSGHFLRTFGSQVTIEASGLYSRQLTVFNYHIWDNHFQGSDNGKFNYPWGICTDSLGFIYVCDKENHRIQVSLSLTGASQSLIILCPLSFTQGWSSFLLPRFSKATALLWPSSAQWAASPGSLSTRTTSPSATLTVSSSPTQTTTDFR